jgi:hypothetical protein
MEAAAKSRIVQRKAPETGLFPWRRGEARLAVPNVSRLVSLA